MSYSRKKQWLALLFTAVVILIMAGSLMPMAEIPESEKTWQEKIMSMIFNLMHVPMYGVLTLVSLYYFAHIRFSRRAGAIVSIVIGPFWQFVRYRVECRRHGRRTDLVL